MSDILPSIGIIAFVYGVVMWHFVRARHDLAEQNRNVQGTEEEQDDED